MPKKSTQKKTMAPNGADYGNTKVSAPIRTSSAVHWVFTFNNYNGSIDIHTLIEQFEKHKAKYIFQEEIGEETKTPHLQGYVQFASKTRAIECSDFNKKIHWEVSGDKKDNYKNAIIYASKKETRAGQIYANMPYPKEIKIIDKKDFYPWQKWLHEQLMKEPDDRTVYWLWSKTGKVGKTQFSRYMIYHHNAYFTSGSASDMKNGICELIQNGGFYPEICIMNIPRSKDPSFISYQGIEELKDATFFSGKYHSTPILGNSPHFVVFANEPPEVDKMSSDRWIIKDIINSIF